MISPGHSSIAFLNPATVLMSGLGTPARPPTETRERDQTTTLCEATAPCAASGSMNGVGNTAMSNASPFRILLRTAPAVAKVAEVPKAAVSRCNKTAQVIRKKSVHRVNVIRDAKVAGPSWGRPDNKFPGHHLSQIGASSHAIHGPTSQPTLSTSWSFSMVFPRALGG